MKEARFALGYMPHRLWGNILQAQILERQDGNEFYTPGEYIQFDESTSAFGKLTPMQQEVVRLMDRYSDRSLHKLFSREKTVKMFQDKVDQHTIREHIRPYIERCLYKMIEIARDNRIPLFTKEKSVRNVFPEDFLKVEKVAAEPVFRFVFDHELAYQLDLYQGDRRLVLNTGHVEIVSHMPAVLILGNSLFFVNEIDAKRLTPFFTREQLIVPREVERKYFSTFVKNTLRDFDCHVSGFQVERIDPSREARLVLEMGFDQSPVWILTFYYNDYKIYPDSQLKRFIHYSGTTDHHAFEQYERDIGWEESIISILEEVGLHSRDERRYYLNKRFKKDHVIDLYTAINFINSNGKILAASGIHVNHRLKENFYLGPLDLHLESREKEDWFDVKAIAIIGEYRVSFIMLKDHLLQGIREYALPGGEVAVLPEEWFARYHSMFEFGEIRGERVIIRKQHFSVMEDTMRVFHPETLNRLEQLNKVETVSTPAIPGGLKADLRTYQVEGYTWLCLLQQHGFGGCLADDMGLGKTIQTIALLERAREEKVRDIDPRMKKDPGPQLSLFGNLDAGRTSMVVVPASLLYNWMGEIKRFAPGLKVFGHVGNQRNKELTNFPYYDVIISTYHTVRQDIEVMSSFDFYYLILDESQMIKNPSSKLYRAITDLRSTHRLVLTGTPIENSLTDLWSQINFVNPGLLGTLSFFKQSFVQPIEKKKDEQREERLKELISPFILRRTKEEVARELPPVFEQVRYCSMTDDQRRAYEEEKSLARNAILENLEERGIEKSTMMVLQALTRLRQLANHPAMLEEYGETDSGKFTEVCRDVENVIAEGHKVLIFSSFVKHLDLFRTRFSDAGYRFAYLTGSRTRQQREEAVRRFQDRADCQLFLISLKAGGVGLNLTAADYVFILDPWWNPAAEMQALNRAHRIGQEKNVFVYRFITSHTIEEKIQHLQQRKQELAEALVSSNNPLRGLTSKEVVELFS
jgi:superfamily II DNA or RNA helicase